MKLPIILSPKVTLSRSKLIDSKKKETVAMYSWWHWTFICFTRIRVGNWRFKQIHEGMKQIPDDDMIPVMLNEETLHWVLHRLLGWQTSAAWDNLTIDLRCLLNGLELRL